MHNDIGWQHRPSSHQLQNRTPSTFPYLQIARLFHVVGSSKTNMKSGTSKWRRGCVLRSLTSNQYGKPFLNALYSVHKFRHASLLTLSQITTSSSFTISSFAPYEKKQPKYTNCGNAFVLLGIPSKLLSCVRHGSIIAQQPCATKS